MNERIEKKVEEIKEISSDLKNILNQDDHLLKENENDLYKTILFIGLSFFFIMMVLKLLLGKKKKTKSDADKVNKTKKSKDSYLIGLIKEQIALFLIATAKRKIFELLERLEIIDEKQHLQKNPK